MTVSRKNMPLHVFIFESWWICPGISALFPGISAFFPGISAQKNRHIFTQSRVRSAQKARNPKLTTIIKKWPFPAPSQEIRPKGRNPGNGHLFVSFRRSRYIYNYIYMYIMISSSIISWWFEYQFLQLERTNFIHIYVLLVHSPENANEQLSVVLHPVLPPALNPCGCCGLTWKW